MISDELRQALQVWRSLQFPEGSDEDKLDEFQSWLAYADTMIAEATYMIESRSDLNRSVPDQVTVELRGVITGSSNYLNSTNREHAESAAAYITYAKALVAVLDALNPQRRGTMTWRSYEPGAILDGPLIELFQDQDQRECSVRLASGAVLRVWNIAWGYDEGDSYAHIFTNMSPPGVPFPDLPQDTFWTNDVVQVTDAASGAVLWTSTPAPS